MHVIKVAALIAAICLSGLLPSTASAATIFDQSVPLTSSSFGYQSDPDNGAFQAADDFQFAGDRTVTDVHWWGVYENNFNPPVDKFTIRIFGDIGGSADVNPLYEFVIDGVDAGRADTGINNATFRDIYSYAANITPTFLAGGTTYWLSIVQSAADSPFRWFWMFEDGGNAQTRTADGDAWVGVGGRPEGITLGFQLTGIPEPSTWALFAAGLAGLGLMHRRRKAR